MNDKISPEVNHQTDEQEDFDPLAELARIVAGENEHVDIDQQSADFANQEETLFAPVEQEETLFASDDMEAELMRELQQTRLAEEEPSIVPDAANAQSEDLSSQVEGINELDASLDNLVTGLNAEPDAISGEPQDNMSGFVVPAAPLQPQAVAPVEPQADAPAESQASETADFQNDLIDALQLELDDGDSEEQEPLEPASQISVEEDVDFESVAVAEPEDAVEEISFEEEMALIIEGANEEEPDAVTSGNNSDEDLGAAFLNEFESRVGYTSDADVESVPLTEPEVVSEPEHIGLETPEAVEALEAEVTSDLELDFEEAFSNELGLGASMDDDTDIKGMSSVAAIEDEIQPQYEDEVNFDPGHSGDIQADAPYKPEEKSGGVRYAVAAICVALLVGAGVAVYGFIGDGKSLMMSEMPVIEATKTAYKTKPENPGGKVVDNQDNATYAEVEGVGNQNSGQTDLVSNTEEPAIIDQSALDSSKDADRLSNVEQSESAGATQNAVVKPRVVKILTVKPGNVIVPSSDASSATNVENQLKLASNQVQQIATEVKTVTTQVIEPLKSLDGAKTTNQIVVPTASPIEKPLVEPKKVTVTKVQTAAIPKKKPAKPLVSQVTNVTQPTVNSNNQPTLLPSVKPAATTQVASANAPSSQWVVQVSSSPSQQEAQSSYNRLARKYSVLQGRSTNIQSAQVNGRTYYRLRLNTSSKADAANLCSQLKASGGDCFITR